MPVRVCRMGSDDSGKRQFWDPELLKKVIGGFTISYYFATFARAWSYMDKVLIGIGRFRVTVPRLRTSGPAAVLGYVLLCIAVIYIIFLLMNVARDVAGACIQWQRSV